jgi:KDO2-lipid IV(A) lauroyltransferase
MRRAWKKLRHRFEYVALVAGAKLVVLLPRRVVVALAQLGGLLASVLDRRGRKVALANLDAAFRDRYSPAEKRRIMRQSYQHFAQTMLDLMWSPRLSSANFRQFIEVGNFPQPAALTGGTIVACFHYSNFEWLSLACGFRVGVGTIIAQEFKNPLLDPIFCRWREQSGHSFTPRKGGILRLYKVLQRRGNTAMLVDLTVPVGPSAVAIRCFDLLKSVTPAHAWLHRRSGAPIIPAHCEPLRGGRYRVVFHQPQVFGENVTLRQIAQACWDSFEPVVRENPAPWLWMYKHWRNRPKEGGDGYPFYATSHQRFERMIRQQ